MLSVSVVPVACTDVASGTIHLRVDFAMSGTDEAYLALGLRARCAY